jgi:sensor histidine kinase YesM
MSWLKLRIKQRGMRVAHLINLVFMIFVVFYYCMELKIEEQTVAFNPHLLLICTPYLLLYILLECWLFPKYIRTRQVRRYSVIAFILVVVISTVWSFGVRPFLSEAGMEIAYFSFLRWIVCFLMCLTVFFVITSNNMFAFSFKIEQERENMAKTKLQLELNLLKYQLNPHFLMNTLNNIHALIDENTEDAQDAVRLLSKIMRYMYYEASKERVDLAKDVEMLRAYFKLMKLRFVDNVDMQFEVPEELHGEKVAPALFVNLVENAMKHGISYGHPSFVHFSLEVNDDKVCCKVRNSKFKNNQVESTGFGLENLKKRLELLYPKQYEYKVEDIENEYFVELIIPAK